MFLKIPFESNIEFNTNISEITKMSLEHDYNVSGNEVLGNFYISGEYKTHEVSINKEPFRYTLPFTVEISDRINEDSLDFNIEDFSYAIVGDNTLKVNIEYSLTADEKEEVETEIQKDKNEEIFERVDESTLEEELNIVDDFLDNEKLPESESSEEERKIENEEEKMTEKIEQEEKVEVEDVKEERLSDTEQKTIMDTIKDSDDTFVTYHVHIVKESESLESISTLYGVPSSLVKEYNDFESLNAGDKVLIPKIDE